jgi:site-specific DNA recombinase
MEAEERQALSIDSQLKEMRVIAEKDGLNVVDVKTEAHSAKNSNERPVFNQMISDVKTGKYNAILTWNPDRLSRNAGDLGNLVDLMDKGVLVEIKTFGQKFSNSPNDKFLLMILCSQAKLENDNKGINVQRGLRTRVEAGLWPSTAPTGYLNSNLRNHLCEKEVDPVLAPVIKEMFEKVAYEDWTNRELHRWLKEKGVKSRTGKPFNMSSVHDILTRTFYYGDFEFPRGSGKWYKGKHVPIITKELFNIVQNVLREHSAFRKNEKARRKHFMFSRFICCGLCGSGISGQEKFKRQKNGNVHRYVYYGCTHGRDRWCKNGFIREDTLIEKIADLIDTVNFDLIGMKDELNKKVDKAYGYFSFVDKIPVPERSEERKEKDLRAFAKIVFKDGSIEEKMKIMKFLKGRIYMENEKIYTK